MTDTPHNASHPEREATLPFWLPGHPLLRRASLALVDGLILSAGLAANFEIWLRYRHGHMPGEYVTLFLWVVLPLTALRLLLFFGFGLYRSISRHTGNFELMAIAGAGTIASAIIILSNALLPHLPVGFGLPLTPDGHQVLRLPWGVVFTDWMLALISIAGIRLLRREIAARVLQSRLGEGKPALIVGAGDAGEQIARNLPEATRGAFRPVAFVDPDPAMAGHRIHGLPVEGGLDKLPRVIEAHHPEEIVIALARPTPRVLSEIVGHCRLARVNFKIVPTLSSVMSGGVRIETLRPVEIEDLLGREAVDLAAESQPTYLRGKRILVTGAGGSIGRELCRQALRQKPESLVMLGKGENSIFEAALDLESSAREAGIKLITVVGDIRDETFVRQLFKDQKPQIVFHAAAHKHVHLMESQPAEAVKNNVLGTLVLARAAKDSGCERFVLISTDKAVRPTGIMGATKRAAEMVVGSMNTDAAKNGGCAFMAVRFGNVLGSRGSVIPTFRRQIAQGGPITVTHPDVTRYFMTTTEAVSLVLRAGEMGRGGELFVLDMGKPVKIADLARSLITLSGLEPEIDIPIVFTGMRPGEKLTEEILTQDENLRATEVGKIFITRNEAGSPQTVQSQISNLIRLAESGDEAALRDCLKTLVPDFSPAKVLSVRCSSGD